MDFIASLVGSLAWPAVVVGALLVFRGPLAELLGRVAEATGFGGSVTFRERLENVEDRLVVAAGETVENRPVTTEGDERESPLARIANAWAQLRPGLAELVVRAGGDSSVLSDATPVGLATVLAQADVVIPAYVEAVSELASLYDDVQEGHFRATKDNARTFERSVSTLLGIAADFVAVREERERRAGVARSS